MRDYTDIYVDGEWIPSTGVQRIDVVNPATEELIATVPDGTDDDVARAAAAAKAAFPAWAALSPVERADWMQKLTDGLQARADEIARTVSSEIGMPYAQSIEWQSALPIRNFQFYADHLREFSYDAGAVKHSLVVREPVGVVGCITPWNYPLHQIALKVAPALAAGCTVVLKPSEVAPLTGYILAEVADSIGLPAGVFNLVIGVGHTVGEAIAASEDIDMVSFTGSTAAGIRVSEVAAKTVKKVALELGGKSANLILDDADLEAAVIDGVGNCFFNAGQTCTALTRMLVPRSRLEEAEGYAKAAAEGYLTGDPFASTTLLGPVVSERQHERVVSLIEQGIAEGASLVTGGTTTVSDTGYFVAPTVFSGVEPDMAIARQEIFGPVLAILPYDDEEAGIELANSSEYGLAGGVWAGSEERAIRVARRLRTGQVSINGGGFNNEAPFGGYKRSGNGREAGAAGFEEFLETKSLHLRSVRAE
ncbi:aldehyde dehydrogenase family protein [Herbiconiux solani]|uniref:aldehyde dehydrogenase family protein n=1 Tax=Herbiconiux solani TaxID=661329 RepID=UPI0008264B52|nr:aldehyde dehydrogenase family protein [Herbiconiux solani]